MTGEHTDTETECNQLADALTRRRLLGSSLLAAVAASGCSGFENPLADSDEENPSGDSGQTEPEQSETVGTDRDSLLAVERQEWEQQLQRDQSSREPSYEYEPVNIERDDESEPLSSVRAAPASEVTGDRAVLGLTTEPEAVESVLRALWLGNEYSPGVAQTTVEGTRVSFDLSIGDDLTIGFGEYSPGEAQGVTELLLVRGESLSTVQTLVDTYDEFY